MQLIRSVYEHRTNLFDSVLTNSISINLLTKKQVERTLEMTVRIVMEFTLLFCKPVEIRMSGLSNSEQGVNLVNTQSNFMNTNCIYSFHHDHVLIGKNDFQ